MGAAWASVIIAACAFAGGALAASWRVGRREGKVDACLEHLTAIVGDHEVRLRTVEHRGHR